MARKRRGKPTEKIACKNPDCPVVFLPNSPIHKYCVPKCAKRAALDRLSPEEREAKRNYSVEYGRQREIKANKDSMRQVVIANRSRGKYVDIASIQTMTPAQMERSINLVLRRKVKLVGGVK